MILSSKCLTMILFFLLVLRSVLEKNLRLLMECVDDLSQDANKYFNYQRQVSKQNQAKMQYMQKRVSSYLISYCNFSVEMIICMIFRVCDEGVKNIDPVHITCISFWPVGANNVLFTAHQWVFNWVSLCLSHSMVWVSCLSKMWYIQGNMYPLNLNICTNLSQW